MPPPARPPAGSPGAGAVPPELVVLGAMKCGTSSLHYYLDLHPEVSMSRRKELNYFIDDEPVAAQARATEIELMRERSTGELGESWYRSQFGSGARVRGESSVAYSFPWFPGTAERIARRVPKARLIFLMRHPLERAISHHRQLAARDRRPLDEALLAPGNPYVEASRYATALAPFLERFPREQLLLLRQDDLLRRRRETLAEIFAFLGVASGFDSAGFEQERNRTGSKGRLYGRLERLRAGPLGAAADLVPRRVRAGIERAIGGRAKGRRSAEGQPAESAVAMETAHRVLDVLVPEVEEVERLTGWSLPDWRVPPATR